MTATATYSPEDNKIRLSFSQRLPREDYDRVRAAGFIWAPKQEIFVAPMWTPSREDLALEFAGEIEDEDKTLVERAEERAGRFEDYSEARSAEAKQAHAHVESICNGIPLGQPILVGHHSEPHARKDADRIDKGMRRAVKAFETAEYWKRRAGGAISAAKYKERPDVRARRIKGIEADQRKRQREKAQAERGVEFWSGNVKLRNRATREERPCEINEGNLALIVSYLGSQPGYMTWKFPESKYPRPAGCHVYEGDLSLWDALGRGEPGEQFITVAQAQALALEAYRANIAWHDRWLTHYANRLDYERAMLLADGGTVTDKAGPEVGGGCRCWCSGGHWSYIQKVNRVSVTLLDNWGNGGGNFTRTIPFDKLKAVRSKAQVEQARAEGRLKDLPDGTGFALYEPKEAPAKPETLQDDPGTTEPTPGATLTPGEGQTQQGGQAQAPRAQDFEAMRSVLANGGAQAVSVPQLFPTPPALAQRMAEAADLFPGCRLLEPSAGTGNLIRAARAVAACDVTAVEINLSLEVGLAKIADHLYIADFLAMNGTMSGPFDRILMNPPFGRYAELDHIRHAATLLAPGGRLVALCAAGPVQREELEGLGVWEDLPPGQFKAVGTNVNVALFTIDKPE